MTVNLCEIMAFRSTFRKIPKDILLNNPLWPVHRCSHHFPRAPPPTKSSPQTLAARYLRHLEKKQRQ